MLDNKPKKPIAKSNSTHRYFSPLMPIQAQYTPPDSEDNDEDDEDNKSHVNAQSALSMKDMLPKTYNQLMSLLSPAMQKICKSNQSHKVQEETNEWFSSIQYLHSNINDLTISNSFLDPDSEFGAVNEATIEALEWKNDKQSNFAIKSDNSKHIIESLGWITDVPVSIKDKAGKTVTVSGNFARIDNGEPEPMLCIEVSEPEQQGSDMYNGEDLKKNTTHLKSDSQKLKGGLIWL
ncbi:hypothetical protein C2G38_2221523 [Gigaspora rosea]|uniref:Uncharacterized protein n=1 Tax=Gigaspora rosea TaxID=44941 RepID=A0A397U372_9GLOM|nr:hypothetical protein C2G38_2221523 [Gigaspora rosea]